ncbi:hypothetical protein Tco_0205844 [Tanacetum coccineum]
MKGHSTLSLEDSLSGDCDVEKNGKWSYICAVGSQEYQVVCTRPDITSTDVDMLDKFDRGLQTDIQVFVDFDYAMGRSITSRYELRLVASIATDALVKGGSRSEVPAQVEVATYRMRSELGSRASYYGSKSSKQTLTYLIVGNVHGLIQK